MSSISCATALPISTIVKHKAAIFIRIINIVMIWKTTLVDHTTPDRSHSGDGRKNACSTCNRVPHTHPHKTNVGKNGKWLVYLIETHEGECSSTNRVIAAIRSALRSSKSSRPTDMRKIRGSMSGDARTLCSIRDSTPPREVAGCVWVDQ